MNKHGVSVRENGESISKVAAAGGFKTRAAADRGTANHGWLQSAHSFSFGRYHDPEHMGFENLMVINDDRVAAGGGFPSHAHKNAEIFSYVVAGSLEHRDTLGNGSVVKSNGIQYMSAGRGVTHSEFNPSADKPVRFLQIWLRPNVVDEAPSYATIDIDPSEKNGVFRLLLARDGQPGSIQIKADADIYAANFESEQTANFDMQMDSKVWIQLVRGSVTVNGTDLTEGDGLAVEDAGRLNFRGGKDAEVILFELLKPSIQRDRRHG